MNDSEISSVWLIHLMNASYKRSLEMPYKTNNNTNIKRSDTIHLCTKPTVEGVMEHNIAKLHAIGQPIATIKTVHTGPNVGSLQHHYSTFTHSVVRAIRLAL